MPWRPHPARSTKTAGIRIRPRSTASGGCRGAIRQQTPWRVQDVDRKRYRWRSLGEQSGRSRSPFDSHHRQCRRSGARRTTRRDLRTLAVDRGRIDPPALACAQTPDRFPMAAMPPIRPPNRLRTATDTAGSGRPQCSIVPVATFAIPSAAGVLNDAHQSCFISWPCA